MEGFFVEYTGWIVAVVSVLISIYSWAKSRDDRVTVDAKWQGSVDAKLDIVVNQGRDISKLQTRLNELTEDVIYTKQSVKQAHKRMDEHIHKEVPNNVTS